MSQLSRLHPVVPNHAPFLDHISEVLPHMKLVEFELGVCKKESLERHAKTAEDRRRASVRVFEPALTFILTGSWIVASFATLPCSCSAQR